MSVCTGLSLLGFAWPQINSRHWTLNYFLHHYKILHSTFNLISHLLNSNKYVRNSIHFCNKYKFCWQTLEVRCYINFNVQKFDFEKKLYIWLEQGKYFCLEKVFSKSAYSYDKKILRSVLQNCLREFVKILGVVTQTYWGITTKRYCEVFCETIDICSTKVLKGILKISWEVFHKTTGKLFAKILKGV